MNRIDVRDYNDLLNRPNKEIDEETLDLCEQLFCLKLDEIFGVITPDLDAFDDVFTLENFFPWFTNKDVGDGAWIKVKTDEGYRIYYAKNSSKLMSKEVNERKLKRAKDKFYKLSDPTTQSIDEIELSLKQIDKVKELTDKILLAEYVNLMPTNLRYVKFLKTKSQWEYLLPYEYELVSDIQLYVDAVLDNNNKSAVKYKQLFTKQDEDQVFYLRSRGIPKDVAIMMCRLQQCYFEVNIESLFKEWMQPV